MTNLRQKIVLFLNSFLILFLELALIRWISTEIRIFAYFQNLVLLACFIGIGLGCYLCAKKIRLYISSFSLSLIIFLIVLPLKVSIQGQALHPFCDIPIFLASFEDTVILYQKTIHNLLLMQAIGFLATLAIFFCILFTFMPLGQILGQIFENCKNPIEAYSINIVAGLLGIWAFNTLSFFYVPPYAWWLLSIIIMGLLLTFSLPSSAATETDHDAKCRWRENTLRGAALFISLIAVGLMISQSSLSLRNKLKEGMTLWSPYQKLTLRAISPSHSDPYKIRNPTGYHLNVNNVGFMDLVNLSDPFIKLAKNYLKDPFYKNQVEGKFNRFNLPFFLKEDTQSVLILGGGAGNDAAAALRAGLKKIDVVEIDPVIYKLGFQYHPEQPYSHPAVHVFVNDARAFIKKTKNKYDMVYFGLLDAHAQSSTMNSMRMDNYVYTQESFEEAKHLLNDNGIFIVTYWAQRLWIAKRIEDVVKKTFGWKPVVVSIGAQGGLGPIMIISGHDRNYVLNLLKNKDPMIRDYIAANFLHYTQESKLITDDWPYLYLKAPKIPGMYLCMIAILMALFGMSKGFLVPKGQPLDLHFFFLGSAFLLLEFQNINKTALLFGMTWIVNSINISMILFLILMANLFVQYSKIKSVKWPYILLFVSLLINFLIPLSIYNSLSYWLKSILASIMLNLPIFFAGIVFAIGFANSRHKSLAFGSNLLGAVAGGLIETVSFVTGIRLLIVITMILYGFSLIFKKC